MQQILKDKADQQINEQFVKDSINNDITRKIIVDHFENIVKEEKDNIKKTHESIALRLISNDIDENLGIKRGKGEIKVTLKRRKPNNAADDHSHGHGPNEVDNNSLELEKSLENDQIQ